MLNGSSEILILFIGRNEIQLNLFTFFLWISKWMGSLEALFHTSRWNCQSRYPTLPNSRMDFLKQLTNPPKLNDLYQGSHVTHRPCGVLLGRMICNLRKSAFPFSNREKKKRKNPDEIVSATSSYYISPGPLIYMSQ